MQKFSFQIILLNDKGLTFCLSIMLLVFIMSLYIILFELAIGPENECLWNYFYVEYSK